jgi:cell division protein FtsZ
VMREMGKAMMGTGEASGEKRALRSAEAAISNPLIDDVSMRGARGVLISITGGKDLTLYEVDEAATRIREEVDPDANIIVGATFDESLDGIIRVSVVATGVDVATSDPHAAATQGGAAAQTRLPPSPRSPSQPQPNAAAGIKPAEQSRIAELAQRLKADNARIADRIERAGQQASRPPSAPPHTAPGLRRSLDQAAAAAVAAALEPQGDEVSIRPMPNAKPGLFAEPSESQGGPAAEPAVPKAFIPPQPERPINRSAPRMPTFEELPLPGQAEYRARHGGPIAAEHPEKRRLTLLQRLAQVGLGRRDDELDFKPAVRPAESTHAAGPERPALRGPGKPPESRGSDLAPEFAKRSAPQGDGRSRAAAMHPQPEDDQLDIPAFLRRQVNL